MTRVVTFDFTDAPPAQGGGSDHIPPGRYLLRVVKVEDGKSQNTNARMVTARHEVIEGPEQGKRLTDQWVITGEKSKFARQRLNAFLVNLGLRTQEKAVQVDLDKLEGKLVEALVRDNTIPATDKYPERLTSKVDSYFLHGKPAAAKNGATPAAAPAPEPVAALPFEEPIEELTTDDDVTEVVEATDALLN